MATVFFQARVIAVIPWFILKLQVASANIFFAHASSVEELCSDPS